MDGECGMLRYVPALQGTGNGCPQILDKILPLKGILVAAAAGGRETENWSGSCKAQWANKRLAF